MRDFGPMILLMHGLGWLRCGPEGLRLTERGATWAHKFQMLFSLTFIEDVWQRAQHEPWPRRIVLA